jgi:hypothetical protein
MKLFEMDRQFNLTVSEEAWGLAVFKALLDRDKTKNKEIAMKEMAFVWYWSDIKSNYLLQDDDSKLKEIRKDVMLPEDWEPDEKVKAAIDYYSAQKSVIQQLYEDTLMSARAIGNYLRNTEALLAERDMQGKVVTDIAKITAANQKVPILMANLQKAYKEVLKEKQDNEGKKIGSKSFNTYEDGL